MSYSTVTFHFLNDAIYQSAAGLLVIARIWRFVRIGHAIVEITNEVAHEEYNGLLAYSEALETLLQEHRIPVPECRWSKLQHHGGAGVTAAAATNTASSHGARTSNHNNNHNSNHNSGSSSSKNNILSEIELEQREKWREEFVVTNHRADTDGSQGEGVPTANTPCETATPEGTNDHDHDKAVSGNE